MPRGEECAADCQSEYAGSNPAGANAVRQTALLLVGQGGLVASSIP